MRISTTDLKKKMLAGEKLTMLTSYGYSMAKMLDNSGIDMILVGDSVGMIELGYSDTLPVTMDDMVHHTQCVVRGSEKAMVVAEDRSRSRGQDGIFQTPPPGRGRGHSGERPPCLPRGDAGASP